jgi:opacity protein-like surface antigen
MNLQRWIAVAAAVLWMSCALSRADEPTPFAAGTWNLSLSGSYVDHIRFSEDYFYNFNVTAGYYFWKNSSFNVDFQGSYVDQPGGSDDALLGAAGLFGRTHIIVHNPWSLFIDGGGMVSYADHIVPITPYSGTNFNFIGKVGGGASWEISDHTFLMGGVRYFHLSNGQIRGKDDNPSFDGVQYWAGVMWTW